MKRTLEVLLIVVGALFLAGCPPYAVTINSPLDGEQFARGQGITFNGSAMDLQDGELVGDSLVWTSNIQGGGLGTGTEFTRTLLPGIHTITLTATNSLGETTVDTITITVVREVPLDGVMTWKLDGVQYSVDGTGVGNYLYSNSPYIYIIQGLWLEGTVMGIKFSIYDVPELEERTYILGDDPTAEGIVQYRISGGEGCTTDAGGGSGTLTITSITSEGVSGTFEFTCLSSSPDTSHNITDGYFDTPYNAHPY